MKKLELDKKWGKVVRYLMFAASTIPGTIVDLGVTWICKTFFFSSLIWNGYQWGEYMLSPVVAFECAVFTNFVVAYFLVWRDRISVRSFHSFWRHFGGYNASCVTAFLVKMGILLLLERIFHWDVVLCNLVALCFSGLINFAFNEWVVFRKKKLPPTPEN